MTIIQKLYLCVGIFAMIILAIQLILIFFGPERSKTHERNLLPFVLRSITAYISIFGWTAFIFTFYTLDVLAFFGGVLIAYIISLFILALFKQDFISAFENFTKKKRENETFPKQISMEEVLKENEKTVDDEKACINKTSEIEKFFVEEKPVEEAVIIIKDAPEEPKFSEIVIPEKEKKAEKPETETNQKEITVKKTTVAKKIIVKQEEPLTEEEQEIQDLLRRLKGKKA